MMNNMMEMLKKNPAMLSSMADMLGPNHPAAGWLKNAKPEDLSKMLGGAQYLVGAWRYIAPVYRFFSGNGKFFLGLIVGYIFYYFFLKT